MSRHDAIKALDIYKRADHLAESLAGFYNYCKGLELARNFQFPKLREPPPSFLTTMEEYILEAPWIGSVSNKRLQYEKRKALTYNEEEAPGSNSSETAIEDAKTSPVEEPQKPDSEAAAQPVIIGDLLGLDCGNPVATQLEESNALALAIISPDGDSKSSTNNGLVADGTDSSEWESELVTTTVGENQMTISKLAGGLDKLYLDSLYDDAARRQQNGIYGSGLATNPFDSQDPFAICNNIAPPSNIQMAFMEQQQQQYYQQQQQMMILMPRICQPHYSRPHSPATNPFGDSFSGFAPAAQCSPSWI